MQDTNKLEWPMFVRFVQQWAKDRNLTSSTVQAQALKGLSELGELADNYAKGNLEALKDDIGDCCVVAVIVDLLTGSSTSTPVTQPGMLTAPTLIADTAYEFSYFCGDYGSKQVANDVPTYMLTLATRLKLDFEECLHQAWNDIRDRKGVLYNGTFVKEADPRYATITQELNL